MKNLLSCAVLRFIWLSVVALGIYPLATALVAEYVRVYFSQPTVFNGFLGYQFTIDSWLLTWSQVLVYDLWSYALLVQLPYSFIYRFSGMDQWNSVFKLAAFFVLIFSVKMIMPQSSIISFFGLGHYWEKVTLLLAITVIICPILNVILDRFGEIEKTQESLLSQ